MEMKKVACAAVVFVAASMSAVLAQDVAAAPASSPVAGGADAAEGPGAAAGAAASGAYAALPALGSLVGASVISFVACYFQ
ncbi:hypothetical protein LINPERPRIM_LOCUS23480 [Linum perenne]